MGYKRNGKISVYLLCGMLAFSAPIETMAAEWTPSEGIMGEEESKVTEEAEIEKFSENQESHKETEPIIVERQSEWNEQEIQKSAGGSSYYDKVTDRKVVDGYYIYKVSELGQIQTALNEAAENATEELPYKVVVKPGTYTISTGLKIWSNTYLSMEGVTLRQAKGVSANMLKVGDGSGGEKGYSYKNITLYGGIWDQNNNSITAVKAAHIENFTVENQVFKNAKNSHFIEAAGVNGFYLKGCKFVDQTHEKNSGVSVCEAVQLDILVNGHFSGYSYEDLTNQNIVVENCTFDNVSRGFGSHTSILNSSVNNVQIINNKFDNIKSAAVSVVNFQNCTITGNEIYNAPRGILIYSLRRGAAFLSSEASSNGKAVNPEKYVKPSENQNIVVSNNTISCSGKDAYSTLSEDVTTCILIGGVNYKDNYKTKTGKTIPAGDYYLSGITITDNKLSTTKNGIQLQDARNAAIMGNTINFKGDDASTLGISLESESTKGTISNNTINKCQGTAIFVTGNSSAAKINKNTIKSAGYCGIYVVDSAANLIESNKINNSNVGMILGEKASAKKINKNTVKSCKGMGIVIGNISDAATISNNTVNKCATAQIYVNQSSTKKLITLKGNKLTGTSSVEGILVDSGKVAISGNQIQSCRYAVRLNSNALATVESNTYKKNKSNCASVGEEYFTNLSKPSITKAEAKSKDSIQLTWKSVSNASGYMVYRATSANGKYKKVGTVTNGTSYADKNLKSKKKYFYKIVAYRTSSNQNTTIISNYSKAASAKTK